VRIFTVGHGTRPIGELLEVLGEAGVRTLVDVRRFPSSRRHPQFNQPALAEALESVGIAYRHAVELGGRGHEVVHLLKPGHSEPHRPWEPVSETRDGVLHLCGEPVA
jgi:uncharacterized protein (DUF488 family)